DLGPDVLPLVRELLHGDVTARMITALRIHRRFAVKPFGASHRDQLVEAVAAIAERMLARHVGLDAKLPLLDAGVQLWTVGRGHCQHDFCHSAYSESSTSGSDLEPEDLARVAGKDLLAVVMRQPFKSLDVRPD